MKKQKSWFRRHWIITILLAIVVLGGIGSIFSDDSNYEPSSTNNREQKEYVELDIYELWDLFVSDESPYTDLQKEEEFKRYDGKWIKSSGFVKDIDDVMLSNDFTLSIEHTYNPFMRTATLYFDESQKGRLLNVGKGDKINFEGRIESYKGLIGIVVKDAELILE